MKRSVLSLVALSTLLTIVLALVASQEPTSAHLDPQTSEPPGLDGHIRDANTGEGLPGLVYLFRADDPSVERIALADAAGYYTMTVPSGGNYDVYGTMIGYYRVDGGVALPAGEVTRQDFDLPAPIMDWAPATISLPVIEGRSISVTLVLTNTGSGDLFYRIDPVSPGATALPARHTPALPCGVDPQVYADLAASPDGATEILVTMAEQADLSAAYEISGWSARGRYVYSTLKATADGSQAEARNYLAERGIAYRSHISINGLTLNATRDTVDLLAAMPGVGAIQPGYTYDIPGPSIEPAVAPDGIGWNVAMVEADRVWEEIGVTGAGIVVASIDTGVEWGHPALKGQYRGWDGVTADHDHNWWDPRGACEIAGYPANEPCDNYWHGTHTMGTMAGSDLPAEPLEAAHAIGVAPGARWITCKGCEMVAGWPCSAFALLECADFVLAPWDLDRQNPNPDLRPHVVNNSWGGAANDGWYFQVISAWRAAGIFPAFGAGNEGPACGSVTSPGDYDNAFTTGATDGDDSVAGFSGRGPSQLGRAKPEVAAPGVGVGSSIPGNAYQGGNGTSMAAPHSAGTVALTWSAQPQLIGQVHQTESLVMHTADPIPDGQCGTAGPPNHVYGWGRINAYRAVSAALAHDWGTGWLEVSPGVGSVEPGEAAQIEVTLDSGALAPDKRYTAELRLETNDPYQGLDVSVPVELYVMGPEEIYLPLIVRGSSTSW